MNFLEVLKIAVAIAKLGMPPAIEDRVALRAWVNSLLDVVDDVTAMTDTLADDKALEILGAIVSSDAAWELMYQLIDLFDGDEEKQLVAAAAIGEEVEEDAELDPATILIIIQAVLQLIKMWRERK